MPSMRCISARALESSPGQECCRLAEPAMTSTRNGRGSSGSIGLWLGFPSDIFSRAARERAVRNEVPRGNRSALFGDGRAVRAKIAESDRIAQLFHGRDRMLPFP